MFEENLAIAINIAKQYFLMCEENLSSADLDDLIQEARIELWRCSSQYVDRGYKFKSYAKKCIRSKMYSLISRKMISNSCNINDNYISKNEYDKIENIEAINHAFTKLKFNNLEESFAMLFFLEGDKKAEIARSLNMTEVKVGRIIDKNLKLMRENLKECS